MYTRCVDCYYVQPWMRFKLLPGGYIGVFDVRSGTGWHQLLAKGAPFRYRMRAGVGSRRERRRTPRDHWLKSEVRVPSAI